MIYIADLGESVNDGHLFLNMATARTSPETPTATPMSPNTTPIMRGAELSLELSDSESTFLANNREHG